MKLISHVCLTIFFLGAALNPNLNLITGAPSDRVLLRLLALSQALDAFLEY